MSTDATVIQPAPGQAILTTDGHGNHHDHYRHHGGHDDWERAILREQAAGFRAAAADRVGLGNEVQTVGSAAALAACHTQGLISDVSKDVALAACKTNDGVQHGFFASQKQVSDAATSTVVGFKDAQATAYQIEGRALLEAAKNANALAVQATSNFNLLQLEAVKNAAAAQLEAQKNAAAQLALTEKCCCEAAAQAAANLAAITATVVAEGRATRDMITANEIANLRAQLASIPRGIAVTLPPVVVG